jgi:hypothetical protein
LRQRDDSISFAAREPHADAARPGYLKPAVLTLSPVADSH